MEITTTKSANGKYFKHHLFDVLPMVEDEQVVRIAEVAREDRGDGTFLLCSGENCIELTYEKWPGELVAHGNTLDILHRAREVFGDTFHVSEILTRSFRYDPAVKRWVRRGPRI